jgi:predicted nucleic acid-binding protein
MILVDSSVWIEVLQRRGREHYAAAVAGDYVVTCLPVIQEVLQGISDDGSFNFAVVAFANIPTIEDPLTRDVFDDATRLYRTARRSGITIRSGVDCLIAACALRNNAVVLHNDRDFQHIAQIVPLKVRHLYGVH